MADTSPIIAPSDMTALTTGRRSVLAQLLGRPPAVIWSAYLALLIVVAILAPVLALYDVNVTDLAATNARPFTPGHPLGGDGAGYDIYSRLVWGTRQTLIAVLIIVSVSSVIGATSGLVAGFYRGTFETVASFVSDAIMSLPGVVLLIALYAVTGPNLSAAMVVLGIIVAPTYYRLVRSIVITVRKELYIDAARVSGLSDLRIVGRHVLWAVRAPIIIHSSFIMAAGIGIESGVSFIGLGDPAAASWGTTLQRSFSGIYNNPWGVVWPSLLISVTILAFVLLGNALSDVLQSSARSKVLSPRQRRQIIAAAVQGNGPATAKSRDDAILSIRALRIGYMSADGSVREVVHGVDFDLRRGEIHGLVGESGSGKSQIAFSCLGILPREALLLGGSIWLGSEDLMADPQKMRAARGRRIAYIPQEPMSNLDPSFTVGAQLIYGLRASRPMAKAEAYAILIKLLARVGINEPERIMKMYPHEISGGMAQRVLICGAVASDPDIIVADEPTTALDVTVQAEVLDLLRELSEERGLAMILVTHNLGVVADLCHTVTVMKDGHFVEQASVDDLFEAPRHAYTKQLLQSSRSVELMELAP